LNFETILFLFFAGALGGALNSVAGGGSFIAFPALLFTGVPPIPANATNTIALWTAAAASGGAYRKRLDVPRRVMIPLLAASLIGIFFVPAIFYVVERVSGAGKEHAPRAIPEPAHGD